MTTELKIAEAAIRELGIGQKDQSGAVATRIRNRVGGIHRELLSQHDWVFARRVSEVSREETQTRDLGSDYDSYALPADYLGQGVMFLPEFSFTPKPLEPVIPHTIANGKLYVSNWYGSVGDYRFKYVADADLAYCHPVLSQAA